MKVIFSLFLFILSYTILGQTRKFHRCETDNITSDISIKNFNIHQAHLFNYNIYLIGEDTYPDGYYGLRMIVLNQQKNKIYETKGGGDAYYMSPYFFETENIEDGTITLVASGGEECWGTAIYHIKKEEVKYLGYLDMCAIVDGDYLSIPKYVNITASKNKINFSFDDVALGLDGLSHKVEIEYYDQSRQERSVIDGNKLGARYNYADSELEIITY
ncbi:hypothetical protein J0X14_10360 [Muricauda sp. CAU 1633]|uniref:hypothetical protein n=1 Tax=Allomuricauda sp. CAU 1633 TaxID=2816036 RepID=UPI001A8D72D3|nr:hypothetical protein [Muricauda sp. CAU 1633]MBO0322699.1 hypothetical protein [Muricauda sp. CAU 1633]